jgi:hypothetical protein
MSDQAGLLTATPIDIPILNLGDLIDCHPTRHFDNPNLNYIYKYFFVVLIVKILLLNEKCAMIIRSFV